MSGGPGVSSFHGTHVTGILGAATDNGLDVAGVTWECPIMPVRALGVGGGSSFDIGEAVRYAAGIANVSGELPDTPATVINMSIATTAGSPPSSLMGNAIAEAVAKGIVVVVAAGNDGSSLPAYPAAFPVSISVAACIAHQGRRRRTRSFQTISAPTCRVRARDRVARGGSTDAPRPRPR